MDQKHSTAIAVTVVIGMMCLLLVTISVLVVSPV
jgi:hypothetical protein